MKALTALLCTLFLTTPALSSDLNQSNIMGNYQVTSVTDDPIMTFTLGRIGRSRRASVTLASGEELKGAWSFDARYGIIEITATKDNSNVISYAFEIGQRTECDMILGVNVDFVGPDTPGEGRKVQLTKLPQ